MACCLVVGRCLRWCNSSSPLSALGWPACSRVVVFRGWRIAILSVCDALSAFSVVLRPKVALVRSPMIY